MTSEIEIAKLRIQREYSIEYSRYYLKILIFYSRYSREYLKILNI